MIYNFENRPFVLLNRNLLNLAFRFIARNFFGVKREAVVRVVFKLEIADIIGGWIDVDDLRVWNRDVDIK